MPISRSTAEGSIFHLKEEGFTYTRVKRLSPLSFFPPTISLFILPTKTKSIYVQS